ncbi:SDR family NAD(P)-dependent oxidoreductase [Sphingobium sp. AP49]|uniref:SDR family NAD(P)-dependent oxidoreductase n=1 Tax=Sphingobium sp. AP49 TaxID=1144307 RepID=UPI00026ED0DB|nr:SDR family NAD(P)-dependent oxidoreductase [Sphingobium sp. AP49]WHO40937.1 SDR family NAD(P)-dependent oxidoreductase [Sphingobium sp. AP49]
MTIKADRTEFAGKRVLVSGGTKGAGRATVDQFLAGGARVITAARGTPEPIDGVEFVQADLATPEGSKALADAALERLGGIDILAHVIGGSSSLPKIPTDVSERSSWRRRCWRNAEGRSAPLFRRHA